MNFNESDTFAEHGPEGKTEVVAAYHDLLYKLKQNKRPSLHHIVMKEEEAPVHVEEEIIPHDEPQILEEEVSPPQEECPVYHFGHDSLKVSFDDILEEAREKMQQEQQRLASLVRALEHENQLARKEIQLHLQKIAVLEARLESNSRQFQQLKISFNELLQNKTEK